MCSHWLAGWQRLFEREPSYSLNAGEFAGPRIPLPPFPAPITCPNLARGPQLLG